MAQQAGLLPSDLDIMYSESSLSACGCKTLYTYMSSNNKHQVGALCIQQQFVSGVGLYKDTRNKLSSTTYMCITSAFQVTSAFICQSECITLWISLICHIFFKEDLSILHNCTLPLLLSVIFGED